MPHEATNRPKPKEGSHTKYNFTGSKGDHGKVRFSLLPISAIVTVIEVMEFGAKKYAPDNWKYVENSRERYFNAAMRHIISWWEGEKLDEETNLPHLAHAVCCLLFLMWGDENE